MRSWRAGLIAISVALPATVRAEQWVYSAHAGGAVGLHLSPGPITQPSGTVLLQSVFGLTDRLNVAAPALIEVGARPAFSLGSGVELVLFNTNHWRVAVGAGVAARSEFLAPVAVGLGPYAMAAVRWLFTWGVGAQLGLHLLVPFAVAGAQPAGAASVHAFPSLALYQEL